MRNTKLPRPGLRLHPAMRLAAIDLGLAIGVHRSPVTITGMGHRCAGLAC
jgi:hypothetical protein